MSIRKNFRVVVFLVCSICVFMVGYSNYRQKGLRMPRIFHFSRILNKNTYEPNMRAGYALSTPHCKMLDPNPWNETVQKYLAETRPLVCSHLPLLTYVDQLSNFSNVLKINKKILKKYKVRPNHNINCCFSVITRMNQDVNNYNITADNLYELSNCTDFADRFLLPDDTEFILVSCQSRQRQSKQGKTVYKDVHPIVPILPEVKLKMKKLSESQAKSSNERNDEQRTNHNQEKMNVIILGIDSVSKLNLRRIMPRTLAYLQENKWAELNGYNKIGENTFPNLMAILSGRPIRELEEICWANRSQKSDDCPSIWKDFSQKGYVTLYAEDTPAISTFNLLRTGFVEKPTDYYIRPLMLAAHDLLHLKNLNGLPVCLGPVIVVDHILNYAKRFFRVFNNYNHFSLLWLNSLTHNDVNAPRALDVSIRKFLSDLSHIGVYKNSLVLFLSDHGVRFGDIRETFMGYLEERLPFMFVWCPPWFKHKYPDKYKNLLTNQNRLTSPYDVYVTIKQLLEEETEGRRAVDAAKPISAACPKCEGLFALQPEDRSCSDASIDINWCLCSEFRQVSVYDETATKIAKYFFDYVVNQTDELIRKEKVKKALCSTWKFLKVFRVDEILPSNTSQQYSIRNISNYEVDRFEKKQILSDVKIYVIIIELNPGRTKFEATVQMKKELGGLAANFDFLEPPKRLDSIYKTSKCVKGLLLKHYCYCSNR